jgi:uncharacterized protein with PQ loop repeat
MKKMLALLLTAGALALGSVGAIAPTTALAQAAPAAEVKKDEAPAAPAAAPAEAPAAAAPAAEPAAAAPVQNVNKGDTAFMYTATIMVILMTIPGLALFYGGLVRSKNMLSVLMQVFVVFSLISVLWVIYGYSLAFTGGHAVLRRPVEDAAVRRHAGVARGHVQQGDLHSRAELRRLPGHLRRHHLLPHRRRVCRADEVLGGAAVHGDLVHLQLPADGAHGLVLGRPGCDQGSGHARCRGRRCRLAVGQGRARLRRRYRGAHQRRCRRSGGRLCAGQADRLRQGIDGAAQPDADHGRCRAAVGGLVRLQRRFQPGSQRRRLARLRQHRGGDRSRRALLDLCRVDDQGQAVDAGCGFRRGGGSGGDHAGLRLCRRGRRAWSSACCRACCASGA